MSGSVLISDADPSPSETQPRILRIYERVWLKTQDAPASVFHMENKYFWAQTGYGMTRFSACLNISDMVSNHALFSTMLKFLIETV